MAYFTSNEVNNNIQDTQVDQRQEQLIDGCIRGNVARNEKYTYSLKEAAFAIYMESQETDPEIKKGWRNKLAYEKVRQRDVISEANRIGHRLPGSVMNDCRQVIG